MDETDWESPLLDLMKTEKNEVKEFIGIWDSSFDETGRGFYYAVVYKVMQRATIFYRFSMETY